MRDSHLEILLSPSVLPFASLTQQPPPRITSRPLTIQTHFSPSQPNNPFLLQYGTVHIVRSGPDMLLRNTDYRSSTEYILPVVHGLSRVIR